MTLESQWKHKYGILKAFISSNPEIHIGQYEVYIPEDQRDRFYKYFDNVRMAIVESWSSSFSFDVYTLSKNYIASDNKLFEKLSLLPSEWVKKRCFSRESLAAQGFYSF